MSVITTGVCRQREGGPGALLCKQDAPFPTAAPRPALCKCPSVGDVWVGGWLTHSGQEALWAGWVTRATQSKGHPKCPLELLDVQARGLGSPSTSP